MNRTSARHYQSLEGDFNGLGAQLLFLQAPTAAAPSPLLHAAPIPRDSFPKSNRMFAGTGMIVSRIGDRNGDTYEDVIVSAGRDCEVRIPTGSVVVPIAHTNSSVPPTHMHIPTGS